MKHSICKHLKITPIRASNCSKGAADSVQKCAIMQKLMDIYGIHRFCLETDDISCHLMWESIYFPHKWSMVRYGTSSSATAYVSYLGKDRLDSLLDFFLTLSRRGFALYLEQPSTRELTEFIYAGAKTPEELAINIDLKAPYGQHEQHVA
jgi:hypothetical protein